MGDDQIVALVSISLALVLALMRLRGELAARRNLKEKKKRASPPPDDFERLR